MIEESVVLNGVTMSVRSAQPSTILAQITFACLSVMTVENGIPPLESAMNAIMDIH